MKALYIFPFFFCAFFNLIAQTVPVDPVTARQAMREAQDALAAEKFNDASNQAAIAYDYFKKNPDYQSDLADAALLYGTTLKKVKKYQLALAILTESVEIWQRIAPEGNLNFADALFALSQSQYDSDEYEGALENSLRALSMREKLLPANDCSLGHLLRHIGVLYIENSEYTKALPYQDRALSIQTSCHGPESLEVADVLGNMGYGLMYVGNYQQSIAAQTRALQIRQKLLPPEHIDIARSCHILGMAHNYIRKFDQSLEYFNKALAIRIKILGENDTRIASSYSEIGRVHLARKDYPAALTSFEKSNAIMVQLDMTQEWDYVYVCKDMAMVNQKLGRPEIALEWQEKCLALWNKSYKKPNSSLASLKASKGSILINLRELDAAEKEYQEALTIWESLLPADGAIMGVSEAGLGNVYRNAYVATGQPSYLDKSRTYFRRFSDRMNKTLQNNNWTDTQRKELFDAIPVIERAIQADLLAYEQNPAQAEALESAWQYSESMHGYLLYAASQESKARHFADIPDGELARDSMLRSEIFQLEKTRQNLLQNQGLSLTDSLVIREDTRIFSKKQERTALLNDFERRYPEYYRLKYNRKTASIADMQARLKPGQTLLEYFTGDSMIFVFVIQPGLNKVVQIKRDFPLNQWTLALREGITGYHTAPEKNSRLYQQTVSQYAEYAHLLYRKLLEPLRPWLTDEIIIIPDENLASIPFEALLQTTPRDLSNFVTYPFFLRTHQVQYAYSATMLRDMEERRHQTQPRDAMLAMAPFFDADTNNLALRLNRELLRIGLSPLPNSGEEVLRAVKRYHGGGDVLLGKDATRQAFWEMASRYRILHLATHGKANPQIGEFSFLAFSPTNGTNESSVCPVGELYQLSLNADLVLLSACETGIGETQRGEGVMSLARAFAFMGAKSIVASLWSVNDRSTMLIMDQFYKESANGKQKHQALALAKRQYLNDNPGLNNHPFFWAAFVGIGDMSSISVK